MSGRVNVRPVQKTWLPEGHDGEIRYTNCAEYLCVQMDVARRRLNTGLSSEDEARLEKALRLPPGTLSAYNTSYWGDFKSAIRIDKNGLSLDLDNPADELIYLVLLAHTQVANSEDELNSSPEAPNFKYVITSEEQEAKVKNERTKVKKEAYKIYGKMSNSKMRDFLKLKHKRVSDEATIDFVEAAVGDFVENDPSEFIRIMSDELFEQKVFVLDCIYAKLITKRGPKYMLTGGDFIGNSIEDAIAYLNDPMNNDIYINLKAKVEINK